MTKAHILSKLLGGGKIEVDFGRVGWRIVLPCGDVERVTESRLVSDMIKHGELKRVEKRGKATYVLTEEGKRNAY